LATKNILSALNSSTPVLGVFIFTQYFVRSQNPKCQLVVISVPNSLTFAKYQKLGLEITLAWQEL
jgi:hypothetical protein